MSKVRIKPKIKSRSYSPPGAIQPLSSKNQGRNRYNKRDEVSRAQDKQKFLKMFKKTANPTLAAAAIGRNRSTVFGWKRKDALFAAEWEDIWQGFIDNMEKTALEQSQQGYLRPVFHQGKIVGHEPVFAPALQIFMLSKNRKEKYGSDIDQQIADLEMKLQQLQKLKTAKEKVKQAKKGT